MRWLIRVVVPSIELAIALLYAGTATRCVAQPPENRAPARRERAISPKSIAYIDLKCGFKFTFSSFWTVTRESTHLTSDSCGYRIIFTRKASNGPLIRHHVEVYVFDWEFEGFEKDEDYEFRDGVWYRDRGMAGKADAHEIRGIN